MQDHGRTCIGFGVLRTAAAAHPGQAGHSYAAAPPAPTGPCLVPCAHPCGSRSPAPLPARLRHRPAPPVRPWRGGGPGPVVRPLLSPGPGRGRCPGVAGTVRRGHGGGIRADLAASTRLPSISRKRRELDHAGSTHRARRSRAFGADTRRRAGRAGPVTSDDLRDRLERDAARLDACQAALERTQTSLAATASARRDPALLRRLADAGDALADERDRHADDWNRLAELRDADGDERDVRAHARDVARRRAEEAGLAADPGVERYWTTRPARRGRGSPPRRHRPGPIRRPAASGRQRAQGALARLRARGLSPGVSPREGCARPVGAPPRRACAAARCRAGR